MCARFSLVKCHMRNFAMKQELENLCPSFFLLILTVYSVLIWIFVFFCSFETDTHPHSQIFFFSWQYSFVCWTLETTITKILCLDGPPPMSHNDNVILFKEIPHHTLFQEFVALMVEIFLPASSNINELRHVVSLLYPKYVSPLLSRQGSHSSFSSFLLSWSLFIDSLLLS